MCSISRSACSSSGSRSRTRLVAVISCVVEHGLVSYAVAVQWFRISSNLCSSSSSRSSSSKRSSNRKSSSSMQ